LSDALILAAGAGTRFGAGHTKMLAELRGRPLLEHVVRAACTVTGLERIVVVLGADAEAVLERVELLCAQPVLCADWATGQAASLRCGARALRRSERLLVLLGDQPLVPEVIERMLQSPPRARAVYRGRPGHPVVLGEEELQAVTRLHGDHGARELLAGGTYIECSDLCSGRDVDTPDDLEAVSDEARAVV
jgi:CTP:molybdopterin cytidylyltransferase MocA